MVLVILVVYLFLQNWRATLIPMIAVPVSLIGTFTVFPLLGFSINTLSLFGLVLAIGLVVDDAIVVVEAVEHHIEEGMAPRDATLQGDGGGVGAGRQHRADPGVGVHPGRVHGRHPGTAEQAVRDHDRHLGADLGVQRADAVAGARGDAAAAAEGSAGLLGGFFGAVQPRRSTKATRGYVSRQPRADPQGRRSASRCSPASRSLAGGLGRRLPTSFVPEEDYGYFLLNVQLPPAASLAADRRGLPQGRGDPARRPKASAHFNTIVGFSLLTRVTRRNNGFYFVGLKPWDERARRHWTRGRSSIG